MTAGSSPGGQVHPDPCIRPTIVQGVATITSIYDICACSSPYQVIAGITDKDVGVRTAVQVITALNSAVSQKNDHYR